MQNYLDLMVKCRDEGIDVYNERTKKTCRTLVGAQLEYDLSTGNFPATTSKKLAFNAMKGELLGFFRGYDNAADFRSLGCKIWDQNANETPAWLANPYRKGHDDLGRIYSKQWTGWNDIQLVKDDDKEKIEYLIKSGYVIIGKSDSFEEDGTNIMLRVINQLENALRTIITNPSDRRIIVSAWNPGELDKAALPPCHMDYRFTPINDKLHVVMTIRSWDLFLGAPFNIASTALFLSIMARLSGYTPGKVVIQATNAHLYEDHFDALEEQLANPLYQLPELYLNSEINKITNLEDIKGVFTRIEPEQIHLVNYTHNDPIKAPMAV
jgi:thymidylate synthase